MTINHFFLFSNALGEQFCSKAKIVTAYYVFLAYVKVYDNNTKDAREETAEIPYTRQAMV